MSEGYGSVDERRGGRVSARSGTGVAKRAASATVGGALLAIGLKRRSAGGAAAALVGGWLVYRGLGDLRDRREVGAPTEATDVERSITVGNPADELHRLWRDPEQFSRIVGHFADVTATDEDRYRWTVRGPLGRDVTWETRIAEERPGEYLRWESVEGATVPAEGSVRFRPASGDRGTVVTLRLRFDPPGGPLGDAALSYLDLVPGTIARKALRRFKSLAETGEIPTLEKNPSARGEGDLA